MSSDTKDPFDKESTPSESSESSHSAGEVSKAEENMEHLKIEERLGKEEETEAGEFPLLDSPSQEGIPMSRASNEPIAGPSGLDTSLLSSAALESCIITPPSSFARESENMESSKETMKVESQLLDHSNQDRPVAEKREDESTAADQWQPSTLSNRSTSLEGEDEIAIYQSQPSYSLDQNISVPERGRKESFQSSEEMPSLNWPPPMADQESLTCKADSDPIGGLQKSPPPERRSSAPAKVCIEFKQITWVPPKPVVKSRGKSFSSGDGERSTSSEERPLPGTQVRYMGYFRNRSSRKGTFACDSANTSSDLSDIPSEVVDVSTDGTPYQLASEDFQKEDSPSVYVPAVERQISEVSLTNISEMEDELFPPETPSDHDVSVSTNTGEQGNRAYIEKLQKEADERGEPISTSSGMGSTNQSELEHLKRWGLVGEMASYRPNDEDINYAQPAHPQGENESNIEAAKAEPRSPSGRRRLSKSFSKDESDSEGIASRLRLRTKSGPTKTKKHAKKSSSESPEPTSSSSDERLRKGSPDIGSSSTEQDKPSTSQRDRKFWQKPGHLRSMRLSTVSSKDSVITEENENQTSPQGDQNPVQMATGEAFPEKMETSPEVATMDSGSLAPGSSHQSSTKDEELSVEVSEFERTVGQTKRPGGKLSNSPPADGRTTASPPKESTSRPKKKTREEEMPPSPLKSMHDSEDPDTVTRSVGSDEEETAF